MSKGETNLAYFNAKRREVKHTEAHAFYAILIGTLSAVIEPAAFKDCVDLAFGALVDGRKLTQNSSKTKGSPPR